MTQKSVVVIGAGLSGLGAARRALENSFEVTVYDRVDKVGGLWYYTDDPDHTCVYEGIITNQPKEINQLPDFFFGQKDQWYFSAKEVQEYFTAYAREHKVDKVIKFNHEVVNISPANKSDTDKYWEVTVLDRLAKKKETKFFDFVAICSGHYKVPRMPKIKGMDLFKGQQMHSVEYRKAEPFRGKRVLIVGSGVSAMDISFLLTKVCSEVIFAHRSGFKLDFAMPDNLRICPVVQEITGEGAILIDGTASEVDAIIYATGYQYSFPFLNDKCGIEIEEGNIQYLYKHCINIEHPRMAFIGMPFFALTTLLFDLQSQFVMKHWSGRIQTPDRDEMMEDARAELQKRLDLGWSKRHAHKMGELSKAYHDDLADIAGVERTKDVFYKIAKNFGAAMIVDFSQFRKEKYEILGDDSFRTWW